MKKNLMTGLFIALIGLASSCTKDIKDDVDNLLRSTPTAIVLMPSEMVVQNGTTLLLPFRVNPSNYLVTLDELSLDVVDHTITRSSYTTSIDEYTLEEVEARKGSDGAVIEGEWMAKIKIKEGQYYSESALALVLKYIDANNNQVLITSSTLTNLATRVKLTDKMLDIESTFASSNAEFDGTPVSSYIRIAPCPISEGSLTLFDMNDAVVKAVQLTGENAAFFDLVAAKDDPFCFYVTPNLNFSFPDGQTRFLTADVLFTIGDENGEGEITKQASIKYYKTEYAMPVTEISTAQISAEQSAGNRPVVEIPIGDALANIGVTSKLFDGVYPPIFLTTSTSFCNVDGSTASSSFVGRIVHQDDKITNPEADSIKLTFFGKPQLGDYYIAIGLTYRNPNESQPRIQASVKVNIRFVD